jgi:NRAMP (natural resistance-associated macrophage protein)-like metal ion transporter
MPAAPPNIASIRKAVEGSKRSADQSIGLSLRGLEVIDNNEKYEVDESEYEIPPGVDTPWTFGSFIRYFGPGWLVCIAYVDPGNYQADIQSGATTGYTQNWVILWTELLSWYVQYMCVKLQHYTNTNLAEAMALQYPKYIRWAFWAIAEISIILTDLPEVIGFAIAINLFNPSVPLWAGVLLSFLTTMLFLVTLQRGSYFIELTACALVVIMSIVLFIEWDYAPTDSKQFLAGAFVPALKMDPSAVQSIISIIGAVVMPHNLYLHSGALESRRAPSVEKYKRQAVKLGLWDPFIPILSTTVVNWAIAALAAIYVFSNPDVSPEEAGALGIASFPKYLDVKGGTILWGIALIAAAQSSCITTTYSGQFVMDGFLKINLPRWARAIITRCVAVVPCVAVAAGADARAMEVMINIVNSSLAFLLPFALIPLVRLTTSSQYMGRFQSGKIEATLIWAASFLCFGINFYTLVAPGGDYFGQYTSKQTVVGVQMNIVQDIVCVFYTVTCIYMAFAPVRGSPLPMRDYDSFVKGNVDAEKANVSGKSVELAESPGPDTVA